MKFIKLTLATIAVSAFSTAVQAQDSGAYINLGVQSIEFDAYAIEGRVGYEFNDYFSVEGQGSFGIIGEDDEDFDISIGLDYSIGGFVRGAFPLGENFSIFARGGYHLTQFGAEDGNVGVSVDLDGFAFGGGLEYLFDGKNGIRGDVTFLDASFDDGGFEVSGTIETYSIAYVRKF